MDLWSKGALRFNQILGVTEALGPKAIRSLKVAWVTGGLVFSGVVSAAGLANIAQFDDLDLSADGSNLLMVRSAGESYDLVVRHLASGDERTLYKGGGRNGLINWCRWGNLERIVCSVRHYLPSPRLGQVIRTRMFAVNKDGENLLQLVPRARNHRADIEYDAQVQDQVLSWLTLEHDKILIQLNREKPNRPSVYRLDIYTNKLERVRRARGKIRRWYASYEGTLRLAIGYRNESEPVVYRVKGSQLIEYKGPEYDSEIAPQPIGFTADSKYVHMSMTNGGDRHGIYRVELATGEVVKELYRDPKFDVFGAVIMHPEREEPVGVSYLAHHPRLAWFDPELKTLFANIRDKLPGSQMRLLSSDSGYMRFIVLSYGGIAPRYFMYDRAEDSVTLIGADYPKLTDEAVVDLQPVEYPARDGLPIPGYLAKPKTPGPHPAILLPHGGPYARDSAMFDSWTQFLVGQGFAVLKPNYRGSVGYGEDYMQAGYKQWGQKMLEDLMDGLDWLVDVGVADPNRVCIVGASFGGYSALVSAYKHADKISCAVSIAGISDLESMVSRIYSYDLVRRNRERIQGSSELKQNSPLRQVRQINVPILLLHGNRDTVVRVNQSRNFAAALARHGKEFRYVEQEDGDHFLSMTRQRDELFTEMSRFLAEHLVPGAR